MGSSLRRSAQDHSTRQKLSSPKIKGKPWDITTRKRYASPKQMKDFWTSGTKSRWRSRITSVGRLSEDWIGCWTWRSYVCSYELWVSALYYPGELITNLFNRQSTATQYSLVSNSSSFNGNAGNHSTWILKFGTKLTLQSRSKSFVETSNRLSYILVVMLLGGWF